jgi:DNA mismatch repair protein MutL
VVLETLRWLREGGPAVRGGKGGEGRERDGEDPMGAQLRELAQLLACKRAVKAGASLAPEEIRSLLEASASAADPRYCPHGRPTSVLITTSELERRFQRR